MDQNAILHMVPNIFFFNFHPLLIGKFSADSSKLEISIIRQHFISISYRFRFKNAKGVKNDKNNFRDDITFLFVIRWDFTVFLLMRAFRIVAVNFFQSLTAFELIRI